MKNHTHLILKFDMTGICVSFPAMSPLTRRGCAAGVRYFQLFEDHRFDTAQKFYCWSIRGLMPKAEPWCQTNCIPSPNSRRFNLSLPVNHKAVEES
jgi:hypothetical protein